MRLMRSITALLLAFAFAAVACAAQKRLVLVDQDGSGPGGSNQMAILALLQAPDVQVLGITMGSPATPGATRRPCPRCACSSSPVTPTCP